MEEQVKKGRGRPKGSKDNKKRVRRTKQQMKEVVINDVPETVANTDVELVQPTEDVATVGYNVVEPLDEELDSECTEAAE